MKSEPEVFSIEDLRRKGASGWDGVRNYQARNYMREMAVGDRAFFYHSGDAREIVGIVEVVRTYYPDPTDATGRFGMVDFRARAPLKKPVTLAEIKAEPGLARLALVRQSRLSVMPIDDKSWARICEMGGTVHLSR
jgi:predicted RNA-binding protein with PUA-like domain